MSELLDVPAADYYLDDFGDDNAPPRLSQSMAHTLLTKSPLHAWREHPRLGNMPRSRPTPEMLRGTMIHDLVLLGGLGDEFDVLPWPDYRKKEAQADRDASIEAGRTPILQKEIDAVQAAADAIRKEIERQGVKLRGVSERVALWTEEASDGTPVFCKARIDHYIAGYVIDLKTTTCARSDVFARKYMDFGYDIQAAVYPRAMAALEVRPTFVNIVAETEPPYMTTIVTPDDGFARIGLEKWKRAVDLWAKCLRENNWPGYESPVTISPTAWQLRNAEAINPVEY